MKFGIEYGLDIFVAAILAFVGVPAYWYKDVMPCLGTGYFVIILLMRWLVPLLARSAVLSLVRRSTENVRIQELCAGD